MIRYGCLLILTCLFSFITALGQLKFKQIVFPENLLSLIQNDSAGKVFVSEISIEGNRRTKPSIILREMHCKTGDSIPVAQLHDALQESQSLIYNTNLFSNVELWPEMPTPYSILIHIRVIERIYLIPSPEFRLSDRNFNEWWKTYNADLGRITYGVKLRHNNLTGNGDRISLFALNGFSRLFSLQYNRPYIDKEMTKGFSVGLSYSRQREIICKTNFDNKIAVYRKENYVNENITFQSTYSLRKGFYKKHLFQIVLQSVNVDDSITDKRYNPNYFGNNETQFFIPELSYTFQYIRTNNINYPSQGIIFTYRIGKKGFGWNGGINALMLDGTIKWYNPLNTNWFITLQSSDKIRLPFKQAFINTQAFGYGDYYLRGLEFRVIDAVASSLNKFTLTRKIVDKKIRIPIKNRYVPYLPIKMYAKTYSDFGYAYHLPEYDTRLNNTLLYTGGLGIDFLSLYDIRTSLEYSFNQLGEKGLFLHMVGLF